MYVACVIDYIFSISIMSITSYHFSTVDSTNNFAKRELHHFDQEGWTLISADEQTQGRGSHAKRWISPPKKNLYLTIVFFTDVSEDPLFFTKVASVALVELCALYSVKARIKWPNDIFIDHRKIAGILIESKEISKKQAIIIGMGLNVFMDQEEVERISQPATSLALESNLAFSIEKIKDQLVEIFITSLNLRKEQKNKKVLQYELQDKWLKMVSFMKNGKLYLNLGKYGTLQIVEQHLDGTFTVMKDNGAPFHLDLKKTLL